MKKKILIAILILAGLIGAALLVTTGKGPSTKGTALSPKEKDTVREAVNLYQEAGKLVKEGKLLKARAAYKKILAGYPQSDMIKSARADLDALNIKILFSPLLTEDSVFYEVQPGDTLRKIAGRYGTTVELIKKSNHLKSDTIWPAQRLKISQAKYSVLVDKSQNILMLKVDGEILKTYTVSTGKNNITPVGAYKIVNKLIDPPWYHEGKVIPHDSPENILGSRWMGFDIPSYGIHGTTDESSIGRQITAGCVRMKNADVEELYSILPVGTEVEIID